MAYPNRGLKDRHGVSLTPAVRHGAYPALTSIDLSSNLRGRGTAIALAYTLTHLQAPLLTRLDLGSGKNDVGTKGATALSAAFRTGALASLHYLSLEGRTLGPEGLASLMGAMASEPGTPSLTYLNVGVGRKDWAEKDVRQQVQSGRDVHRS